MDGPPWDRQIMLNDREHMTFRKKQIGTWTEDLENNRASFSGNFSNPSSGPFDKGEEGERRCGRVGKDTSLRPRPHASLRCTTPLSLVGQVRYSSLQVLSSFFMFVCVAFVFTPSRKSSFRHVFGFINVFDVTGVVHDNKLYETTKSTLAENIT